MVEQKARALDGLFQALSDPTRRAMLRRLSSRERSIGELAEPLSMSIAAVSKHVKVLERAGLVKRRVVGRSHICRINPAPLAAVDAWLEYYRRFWRDQFEALDDVLAAEDRSAQTGKPRGKDNGR